MADVRVPCAFPSWETRLARLWEFPRSALSRTRKVAGSFVPLNVLRSSMKFGCPKGYQVPKFSCPSKHLVAPGNRATANFEPCAYPIFLINTNVGPTTHPYYTKLVSKTTFAHSLFLIIQIFYSCLRPKIKFSNHE